MGHASTTFREVEELLVARIIALDASAFTDGRKVAVKWHESTTPLSVIASSAALSHLAFNVWVQSAPNSNDNRGATWVDDDVDNDVELDCRLKIAFAFSLRPTQQVQDARLATDAAVDVTRAIMAPWTADDEDDSGAVTIRLVDPLQTALSVDGGWLLISQDYVASFDFDLLG